MPICPAHAVPASAFRTSLSREPHTGLQPASVQSQRGIKD